MRKLSISITALLIISACGAENNGNGSENGNINGNDQSLEENISQNQNGTNNNNEENDNEEDNEEVNEQNNEENHEEAESEELEVLYELQSDHTVRPIDDADEQVVLFTIDDAPDNHGVEMAEILQELDVPAIFFVNGHFINSEEGAEELQAIYDLGFEIGNHSMTHPNFNNISEEQQHDEIVDLNDKIEEIIGERPRFYRAPFGVNTDYSKQVVEDEGMQWMNWTYGYDYFEEYMEKDALADIMVNTELLRDGANLLMHDRDFTKEALEDIVEGLREKGYGFVDPDTIK
ncbi:polysaccharide deacetylase family protein [Salisediminibacterium beveridgei]|uniref:Chitooligosaccharide deacetylase n=1 Tax=Salisediminibacterium beveridgei TaxID=632773 RepID=A0A1D7QWD2_9BACI|nr:polysaccharide deacetylase family protein [Salisediminibacterium beveridgei]AOM83320.1 Chitooligosaccharide deacetylase [Salisediminibacterium beveridgei]